MMEQTPKRGRGRPTVAVDAISSFIDALRVEDGDDYAALWQAEWDAMAGKSIATKTSYTSRFRKAVREALGAHPVLAYIKVLEKGDEPLRTATPGVSNGGRPSSRRERIEAFAEDVKELDGGRAAAVDHGSSQALADANFKRALAKRWSEEVNEMRAALAESTILNTTSQYRNELRNRGIDDDVTLAVVSAPEDIMKSRTVAYREAVIEQHNDLVPVHHWRELLDVAVSELPATTAAWQSIEQEAKDYAADIDRTEAVRIGVALGFVTGRRPYEIFCQSEFRPAPIGVDVTQMSAGHAKVRAYESWRVLFAGQAKTRARAGTQFDKLFIIPTLAPAKNVIFAWHVLRSSEAGHVWRKMTNDEFKNDLLNVPGVHCILPGIREEMFSELWPEPRIGEGRFLSEAKKLKANNIRALYAEIADQFFRPKEKTKAAYFSEILGHTEKDIETAAAYMKYWLPDQKDAGATRRVKKRLSAKIEDEAEAKGLRAG